MIQRPLQQDMESQLLICYQTPQMSKYIKKQISQMQGLESVKCLSRFTLIKFKLSSTSESYSFTSDNQILQFLLVLGRSFPLSPPRLHILTNLYKPGINDCRDLLPHVIGTEDWDYRISLKNIQKQIKVYLSQLNKNGDIYYIARIGHFHLNTVYPIQLLKEIRGDNVFYAFQLTGDSQFKMVVVDVSATHIAIFVTKEQPVHHGQGVKIPTEKDITLCMLNFYAQLGSLTQIYVDRSNFSDMLLTFTSQKPHNMSLQSRSRTKHLKVKKGLLFLHKLLKSRKYYDFSAVSLWQPAEKLEGQQKKIIEEIQQAEFQITHHLNIETIQNLADLYQSAVEYYSSNNIPYYELYLEYITKLYQRRDVRLIMGTQTITTNAKK